VLRFRGQIADIHDQAAGQQPEPLAVDGQHAP
jgi:hypothetical protein